MANGHLISRHFPAFRELSTLASSEKEQQLDEFAGVRQRAGGVIECGCDWVAIDLYYGATTETVKTTTTVSNKEVPACELAVRTPCPFHNPGTNICR
jgi:hypothetical protein